MGVIAFQFGFVADGYNMRIREMCSRLHGKSNCGDSSNTPLWRWLYNIIGSRVTAHLFAWNLALKMIAITGTYYLGKWGLLRQAWVFRPSRAYAQCGAREVGSRAFRRKREANANNIETSSTVQVPGTATDSEQKVHPEPLRTISAIVSVDQTTNAHFLQFTSEMREWAADIRRLSTRTKVERETDSEAAP